MASLAYWEPAQLQRWTETTFQSACDDFTDNTVSVVDRAASQLTEAAKQLRSAQQALRDQAGNVHLLAAAAAGDCSAMDSPLLLAAGAQIQEALAALDKSRSAALHAGNVVATAMHCLVRQPPEGFRHTKGIAALMSAAAHRRHNTTHSRLLSLPDTALQSVAHKAGKDARLVCQQLQEAYGGHQTTIVWPKDPYDPEYREAYASLPASIITWRWSGQLTKLHLNSTQHLPLSLFANLAASLPQLQYLHCPWPVHHQPADATASIPTPLTSLTSISLALELLDAPSGNHSAAVPTPNTTVAFVPHLAPHLASLEMMFDRSMFLEPAAAAVLQQLTSSLTHLKLGFAASTTQCSEGALQCLAALSGALQSLELESAQCLGEELAPAVAALQLLTSLKVGYGVHRDDANGYHLPPCSQLPRLQALDLERTVAVLPGPSLLDAIWGSATLSTGLKALLLPRIQIRATEEAAGTQELLRAMAGLATFTQLTRLSLDMCGMVEQPDGWVSSIGSLRSLRWLSLHHMAASELRCASETWGTLTALTDLDIGLLVSRVDEIPEQRLQQAITQLQSLRFVELYFATVDEAIHGVRWYTCSLLLPWCLKSLAALPRLHTIDLTSAERTAFPGGLWRTEDLEVLSRGSAAGSLRQLLLSYGTIDEHTEAELAVLLPNVQVVLM